MLNPASFLFMADGDAAGVNAIGENDLRACGHKGIAHALAHPDRVVAPKPPKIVAEDIRPKFHQPVKIPAGAWPQSHLHDAILSDIQEVLDAGMSAGRPS